MKILTMTFLHLLGITGISVSQQDSLSMLFNDSEIKKYELTFYYANWEDSLKYYKGLSDESYIPARFVYRKQNGDSITLDSIGVRYKGNSSYVFARNSPKKPFKFRFNKYRKNQVFFGVQRLNFSNGAKDPSMMREKISYDIIGKLMPASHASFATISIEGKQIGLFTQVEQIDNDFLKKHFKNNNGNLYKSSDAGSTLLYAGPNQSTYESQYELKTNESKNDWSGFIDFLDQLNNTSSSSIHTIASTIFDVDIICKYLAFNAVFSNYDSYTGSGRNFYLYDDPDKNRFTLIPWDLNLSFGAYSNNWNVSTADIKSYSNSSQRPLIAKILENDSLKTVYLHYVDSICTTYLNADTIKVTANKLKSIIDSSVASDSNNLSTYENFLKNIESDVVIADGLSRTTIPGLVSFCTKRSASIKSQLLSNSSILNFNVSRTLKEQSLFCGSTSGNSLIPVHFTVASSDHPVSLEIFSSSGTRITTLYNKIPSHKTDICYWNTKHIQSGCYLIRMTTPTRILTKKTNVLR